MKYIFGKSKDSGTRITSDCLYDDNNAAGFLTERNRMSNDNLALPEINSGFEPWYWYNGKEISVISDSPYGCSIDNTLGLMPLSFKCKVSSQGNYHATITVRTGNEPTDNLIIFTGRRRLCAVDVHLGPNETYTLSTIINVTDIVPRGHEEAYYDDTVDITIVGNNVYLYSIDLEKVEVPTIYIAGDSTVTDQSSAYPYVSEAAYSGWGQALTLYVNDKIAVSNHSHSGLTTESFTKAGHYAIVQKYIKKGDYLFIQFAHNDQKLDHLKARSGYLERLQKYVEDTLAIGATPVIVSPLSRNSFRGDNTFNDLLIEYAQVCKEVAASYNIPLIDLHKKSVEFILEHGLNDSTRYFYPKDYTHTNDYGAFVMASFVADEMLADTHIDFSPYIKDTFRKASFTPPENIRVPEPPAGLEYEIPKDSNSFTVPFTDIDGIPEEDTIRRLTSIGVIPNDRDSFRPDDKITRIEFLAMLIKTANFFPTNVYNDMFTDVVGDEWYAGSVECAYSNGLISDDFINDNKFMPLKTVTIDEAKVFLNNTYKSRKASSLPTNFIIKSVDGEILRKDASIIVNSLYNIM